MTIKTKAFIVLELFNDYLLKNLVLFQKYTIFAQK